MRTQTLDLQSEADDLREKIADLEADIEAKVDEALALDPPENEDEEATLAIVEDEYDELEVTRVTTQGYVDILDEHIEQWDGSEIVLKELSASETRMVRDEAKRDAQQMGFEQVPSGKMELAMMEAFTVSTPPGAPDPSSIGSLPDRLFNWLYGRGNALNTVGDMDMGNSSLKERMMARRS